MSPPRISDAEPASEGPLPLRSPSALAAAGALLLAALAAFGPVASGKRTFFHLDLLYEHLPIWEATQRALRSGESPFWLDGEYCGHPALFLQEAPLLYPPTAPLLSSGGPVHRLADLFSLAHYWLAGFAALLLLRELTGSGLASLFGAIAWMLSARMVQTAIWPNAVAASAFVPAILLGLWRIGRGRRRSGIVWTSVAGGLALLTGRPHVLLAASPLILSFGVVALARSRQRARALGDLAVAGILALALGAPAVLPSLALLPETSRVGGLSPESEDPQPLARGKDLDLLFLPMDSRSRWPEAAAYAGALPSALFLFGCLLALKGRLPFERAALWAALAGGLAGLLLAFGDRGPYGLVSGLPLVRGFRVPERFLLSWSLALALVASLALAYWLSRSARPRAVGAACLVVVSADLIWHARRTAPTAPAEVYDIRPAVVDVLRRSLEQDAAGFPGRFISMTGSLNPVPHPEPVRWRLLRESVSLKGALGLRYGLESAYGAGPTLQRTEQMLFRPSMRALELAGVRAVIRSRVPGAPATEPPVVDLQDSLPRAILVPESLVVPSEQAVAVTLSPKIDPRATAVLEEGEPLARDPSWNEAKASVRLHSRRPGRVALEAYLPAPGILVLFDSFEAGWRATANGVATPVMRADGAFRAVGLPAGAHRVVFDYTPPWLREGLALGLAGALGLVLIALRLSRGGSRRPSSGA